MTNNKMAHTISKKTLDRLADLRQKELETPSIYELALETETAKNFACHGNIYSCAVQDSLTVHKKNEV